MIGKQIRMERIMNRDNGRTLIVPMDHGVSAGPISGLEDMETAIDRVVDGGSSRSRHRCRPDLSFISQLVSEP